jgi:hypothetical protein
MRIGLRVGEKFIDCALISVECSGPTSSPLHPEPSKDFEYRKLKVYAVFAGQADEHLVQNSRKEERMATPHKPTPHDIDNIKKALVSANVLKAATLSKDDEAKVHAELARHGVDAAALRPHLWCNDNYCIIVRQLTA